MVQHDREEQQQHASGRPEQALRPAVVPGDGDSERGGDEKRDGEIVVGREDQRADNADEEGSGRTAGSDQQIEEGCRLGQGRAAGAGRRSPRGKKDKR